ncbi:MAG: serine hydrolase [Gammaproteobacteria bacterium]|nr:serine hydrolase [Gammaproteobacteria bacterium]
MKKYSFLLVMMISVLLSGCHEGELHFEPKGDKNSGPADSLGQLDVVIDEQLGGGLTISPKQNHFVDADDPNEIGWASIRDLSKSAFVDKVEFYRQAGYRMQDVEIYMLNNEKRYSAVFRKNDDGRDWQAYFDLSANGFNAKVEYYKNNSGRMIDQEVHVANGIPTYSGIWIENTENLESVSYHDVLAAEFNTKFAQYKQTFIPVDYESYIVDGKRYYSMVWRKNVANLSWRFKPEQAYENYVADFNVLKGDYRLQDLEIYMKGQNRYYTSIWVENLNGRYWESAVSLNSQQFSNKWNRMKDAGYRLVNFMPYVDENGFKYAGIWRQNSDRPNWELKSQVDDLAVDFWQSWNIPSVSVGIAVGGEIKYLRGVGEADIANQVAAHADSVYRLASVSKAIGGVLTMKLVEKHNGNFNLDDFAKWDWLNSLPEGHDYTVGQLVANRSGIGTYGQFGSDTDNPGFNANFDSAWNASQFIISEPLNNRVGEYEYSTHGYTVLGAVLEQVELKNIFDIVKDEITIPYAVPTLRQEFRNQAVQNRVKIYTDADKDSNEPPAQNVESARNDITWKTLGGGLEASTYDLLRFGMKLANEEIISKASMDVMWSDPTPGSAGTAGDNGSYNYGWNVGTFTNKDGNNYLKAVKDGGALGVSSYITIVPDLDIVIVVLTNRRYPHFASSLAVDIEDALSTIY